MQNTKMRKKCEHVQENNVILDRSLLRSATVICECVSQLKAIQDKGMKKKAV